MRRHNATQAALRLRTGGAYNDQDLVCARWDGSFRSSGGVSRAFVKLIRKLDLPQIRLRDLRHSHATQLLRAGIHPKVVSERVGHATSGITLDTYSHVMPVLPEEAAKRIDTAMRAAMKRPG